ncbi:ParB/Sulfiredoxin [uncultured Caudovirales phage]|uniref:ParB/Sulfiredoxin n=1 Tax=uncultured Caudovirales phage TaxID=2100421 RepID=A0A6J5N3C6_9CAUD|nr:ParB/Sulfiredoxin [uncultured Caudovirales phage]
MAHNIRTEIARLAQPINNVQPHPRNVRQGDVGVICQSLEAHGQYRPIVVHKSTNNILAGNHTWQAANALGWEKIACTYVDCDDEQALRILLADNRANDLASYDDSALAELLKDIANSTGLEGTLFEPSDLDDLLAMLEAPMLSDVIADIGEHDDDDDFSGMIKIRVSLSVYERWKNIYADLEGADDDERILSLLNAYDSHR